MAKTPAESSRPSPSRFGTLEGYAQQVHEHAAGLAEDLGVDLCDPEGSEAYDDLDDADKALVDAHRVYHDEAVRHGAICDGIHATSDEDE